MPDWLITIFVVLAASVASGALAMVAVWIIHALVTTSNPVPCPGP